MSETSITLEKLRVEKKISKEEIERMVESLRKEGNLHFRRKEYEMARKNYNQALSLDEKDKVTLANRSASLLALERVEEAIEDARRCLEIDPEWSKGYYRLGSALSAAERWPEAQQTFQKGMAYAPDNADFKRKLEESERFCSFLVGMRLKQMRMDRRDLALQMKEARRKDKELATLNQLKQGMSSPDWEIEDQEWRPTYFPGMRLQKLDRDAFLKDPKNRVVHTYVSALADLDAPKKALPILEDSVRLRAFDDAIKRILGERPGSCALTIGAGTGVLQLIASRSGAEHVFAFERSHMLFRMAKQAIVSNRGRVNTDAIQMIDRPLKLCYSHTPLPSGASVEEHVLLKRDADVLITDMFDHNILGLRVLEAVDHAARHILRPGAIILPAKVKVKAMLIEMRISKIAGLDLSALNNYRWHPQHERLKIDRESYTRISDPFDVCTIDLQGRVDALTTRSHDDAHAEERLVDGSETVLQVDITSAGCWNAILMWFDLVLDEESTVSSWNPQPDTDMSAATSWSQALQYIDEIDVNQGESVELHVFQDLHQIFFRTEPMQSRPRHAWVPRWHFDMVLDEQRNLQYESAVRSAIQLKKDMGQERVEVLDVGSGSGLLSMLAARAGADCVTGAEISSHMCDVGALTEVMNGFAGKCTIVNQDSRFMDVLRKPDGTAPDMKRKADILVYEVFDSGLIGEGALHLVYHAQQKLLQENAALVPMAATIFAQPIQLRVDDAIGFDYNQANRWRWRPDYEGIELERCKDSWIALGKATKAFDFDFYDIESCIRDHEKKLQIEVMKSGTFNAVAFWFTLHLDEETSLDTSPYTGKGATWQQAVQYMEEIKVEKGETLALIAKHDSYGISFEVDDGSIDRMSRRTGVPQYDPVWYQRVHRVQQLNKDLAKATAQNPLEYRSLAVAAVELGSRPWDLDLDTDAASEFCTRMMS